MLRKGEELETICNKYSKYPVNVWDNEICVDEDYDNFLMQLGAEVVDFDSNTVFIKTKDKYYALYYHVTDYRHHYDLAEETLVLYDPERIIDVTAEFIKKETKQ